MTHILAFDTAMFACTAAVLRDGQCLASEAVPMQRGQAEELAPMIERVMKAAGVAFSAINVVGTTIGPGAFTGLRIGLSAARAIGLALNVPVIGVTTFDVIARHFFESRKIADDVLVLIETKRQDFYFQFFSADGKAQGAPQALPVEDIVAQIKGRRMILIGDATERFLSLAGDGGAWTAATGFDVPRPDILGRIVGERFAAGGAFPVPEPLYLRDADVTMSKKIPRKIV